MLEPDAPPRVTPEPGQPGSQMSGRKGTSSSTRRPTTASVSRRVGGSSPHPPLPFLSCSFLSAGRGTSSRYRVDCLVSLVCSLSRAACQGRLDDNVIPRSSASTSRTDRLFPPYFPPSTPIPILSRRGNEPEMLAKSTSPWLVSLERTCPGLPHGNLISRSSRELASLPPGGPGLPSSPPFLTPSSPLFFLYSFILTEGLKGASHRSLARHVERGSFGCYALPA